MMHGVGLRESLGGVLDRHDQTNVWPNDLTGSIFTVVEETKRAGRPACTSMHRLPARLFLPSHTRSYRLFPHILKRHLMPSPLMLLMSTFLLKRWQDWPVPAVHLDMRRRNRSLELSPRPHDYCKKYVLRGQQRP